MQPKYKRLLSELLDSGKLNEWEQNVFGDIYNRDESNSMNLSIKQKNMIDKAKGKYIDGLSKGEVNKSIQIPTEYPNCKLLKTAKGYLIEANGEQINVPTTKKEGVFILAWLTEALPELTKTSSSTPPMTDPDFNTDPDSFNTSELDRKSDPF